MKFFRGLWEHENFMDIYMEILAVPYQDEKRAKLRVIWWNKGWTGNPYQISNPVKLKITNFKGWRQLRNPTRTVTDGRVD